MKRATEYSIVALVAASTVAVHVGCGRAAPSHADTDRTVVVAPVPEVWQSHAVGTDSLEIAVETGPVHLRCARTLADSMRVTVVAAEPLRAATDKPDHVWPRHYRVELEGGATNANDQATFTPEVRVFPVAEYREAIAVADYLVAGFDADLSSLATLIETRPARVSNELPFFPWIDALPEFQTRMTYLPFRSGEGLAYVAHFGMDSKQLSNDKLVYAYFGLTRDRRWLVAVQVPVSARYVDRHATEALSGGRARTGTSARVASEFEREPTSAFSPRLDLVEDLIRSIDVTET